jgi:bifunctional DNA-binding transcriptional regulator/antitoxin component of YhaV-PrlF toxin-antitoxin module
MSLESTATSARPKTKSLRATIPEGVVAFLNLESGDSLEWKMDIEKNERIVIVKKKKERKHAG